MHSQILRRKDIIFLIVLILIIFSIYFKTLHYNLIFDSKIYFTKNPLYVEDYPIITAFTNPYCGSIGPANNARYYRPLTTLTFLIEKKIWGLNNINLRVVNILIFSLTLIVLFIFFKEQAESKGFPFLATGLFAFFPLTLDNIVWIVGRSDLFLLLWGSLSILNLEFYLKKKKLYFLFFSSLFYIFGILSKESTLFFIPILFIYEFVKSKKITPLYHLSNLLITILFLLLKSFVVDSVLLKFSFFSNLSQNIKMPLAVLGYYFKSIFYPFNYDSYLPLDSAVILTNILSGIVLLLIVLILFLKALKERIIFIPLSFIVFFLFGHLLLVYTPLVDFRASSRFMMIPVVGFIWILYLFLKRFKPFIAYTTFSTLILFFIPALIMNASIYKNEVSFWKKFSQSFPHDSYILFHRAESLSDSKPIDSIFLLNKAMRGNLRLTTFVDMSLLYEEIESRRGNYKKAFEWLNRIKIVPNLVLRKEIEFREAKIYLALGEIEKVEKILNESFKGYDDKKYYSFIYRMYQGFELWEKAEKIEKIVCEKFPDLVKTGTKQIREKIKKSSPNQRLTFFLEYHNYNKAIEILLSFPKDLRRDLFLTKLYYLHGKQKQAELIIEDYVIKNPDNFKIFNSIGRFFLNEMIMVEKAHFFFKKSLKIKKAQPELIRLVNYLEKYM